MEKVFRESPQLARHPDLERVQRIGQELAAVSDMPGLQWNFVVVADSSPNAANIGFIHLNRSCQPVAARANHCATQFVEPIPCSIVTSEAKNPLKSEGTGSIFLTGYKPHGEKPGPKRLMRPMKQRSSCNGSLFLTFYAQKKPSPH